MPAQSAVLTITGDKDLVRRLVALGAEAPRIAAAALNEEAETIMTAAKQLVPVDFGTLKGSGHIRPPRIAAGRVVVEMGFGGAAAPYAVYVHEGRRPGRMPPIAKMEEWARRHGFPAGSGFMVARAIGRRGIKPTKYLERPFLAALRGMNGRLAVSIRRRLDARAAR